MQNHIEYLKHVHEAHHENQHRVHEKFQENFYDVNERQQEGSESDQEAYERSQEDLRSADSNKRSTCMDEVIKNISLFIHIFQLFICCGCRTLIRT